MCHCETAGKGVKFLGKWLNQPKQSHRAIEIATGGLNEET
jgi:hypothetical protein